MRDELFEVILVFVLDEARYLGPADLVLAVTVDFRVEVDFDLERDRTAPDITPVRQKLRKKTKIRVGNDGLIIGRYVSLYIVQPATVAFLTFELQNVLGLFCQSAVIPSSCSPTAINRQCRTGNVARRIGT